MKVIPRIYEKNTDDLIPSYLLGSLPDAISCTVTEELNGEFCLDMTYPMNGMNAGMITVGRIIAAAPNPYEPVQAFRIETIEKDLMGTMTISANHVSMDLSNIVLSSFGGNISLALTLTYLSSKAKPANNFTFSTDLDDTRTGDCTFIPLKTVREVMLSQSNSVSKVFDGDWKFSNWDATLTHRGTVRNMQIAYGKNLTGLTETDELGAYDAIYPFAQYQGESAFNWWEITDTGVCATAPLVYVNGTGPTFGFPRVRLVDLSDKYTDFQSSPPSSSTLYAFAQTYIAHSSWKSKANFSTDFVDLAKILGKTERVELGDTLYISVPSFGVTNLQTRVKAITYDCLLDQNTSVVVGDKKITLADTLAELMR